MRLKKIRLAGFKSFVDPTNIPFPGDMTAVVGPNGCGKSNIIDAVRWVLGESSAKNLRGDAMTDVIFNGSSARKPVFQCSVELVFDNTSGRIQGEFAAYNEISVKRVVTKDAVSTYFLNSAKCRRRDITDLFLGTGLGPRSYAIIEQGMISKLIESKPQELRVFIEEAAGISKYKERRKETHTRIKHTKENLERLEDVRQELGEQIAKLKRQATAANRYKELKQQERQLKAELATIKWASQSEIMAKAQDEINEKQQALDTLISSQQGDESGIQALKNQQSISKQNIDDLQLQIFTIGSDITKLEQSQLFAKKRSGQIQSEIEHIKQSDETLSIALESLVLEIEQGEEKLLQAEPDKEIAQEKLYELEDKKQQAETRLHEQLKTSREKEDAFYTKTQNLQQKHSQIQQILSLQERTETRLNELTQEYNGLNDATLDKELEHLSVEKESIETQLKQCQDALSNSVSELSEAKSSQQVSAIEYEECKRLNTGLKAKVDALIALQHDTASTDESESSQARESILNTFADIQKEALWEYFKVDKGAEQMLFSALRDLDSALIINADIHNNAMRQWDQSISERNQQSLLFKHSFTAAKTPGTLASMLDNDKVPTSLNYYYTAKSYQDALEKVDTLKDMERVITPDGAIFTKDSLIKRPRGDNKILRAAQIETLQIELIESEKIVEMKLNILEEASVIVEQKQQYLSVQEEQLATITQTQQSVEISFQNMQFKQQQTAQRTEKLTSDISEHKERLDQEKMSLEILNDEVEDLSVEVLQLEDAKESAHKETEVLSAQQQQWQAQHSQFQSSLHEQSMLVQQIRNSLQILQEQQSSKKQLFFANQEKLDMLSLEADDLVMPQAQQQEKLQKLLEQQQLIRESLGKKQQELADIESNMSDLEKGQHGIVAKMDVIKSEMESQRIRVESANVRAQSYIEQLSDLQQSVKEILATLSEGADENTWQNELDKVSGSILRLGAVNLAAVDEYEEQAKRKEYLDAQNLDLTKALDTLENAMRKIDKETRSRFKQTFDQVNSDLKSLFPKVFGGGMAYLDLTDDDMLDTGVTIMARPPGKKNSTIHLLSGGEKALTALSLVFAIFRLNPAPFCLLDEVDAPLDDANVGRFCRLVSQMSASVQFIYITHNKVAMEMATHLTGVTMAEPGVSRMVAVDMEQALAIAE